MEIISEIPIWLIWSSHLSALIAIPGAIAAFFMLFWKDRSKQQQIGKLTIIASSLDAQNSILQQTLNYYRKQLQILTNISSLSEKNSNVQEEMYTLDREIKLAQFKPVLKYTGGSSSPREAIIQLLIANADALNLTSEVIENDNIRIHNKGPYNFIKDKTYGLVLETKRGENANRLTGKLMIKYSDQLSSKYNQTININRGKIDLEDAIKIE